MPRRTPREAEPRCQFDASPSYACQRTSRSPESTGAEQAPECQGVDSASERDRLRVRFALVVSMTDRSLQA